MFGGMSTVRYLGAACGAVVLGPLAAFMAGAVVAQFTFENEPVYAAYALAPACVCGAFARLLGFRWFALLLAVLATLAAFALLWLIVASAFSSGDWMIG